MCYYTSIATDPRTIMARFGAEFGAEESFRPAYSVNAFSYPEVPVISSEAPGEIVFYTWGLIPSWVKSRDAAEKIRQRTLNARAETVFEKPSFRHAVRTQRCLVIADGFFEWRHIGRKTYPYHISLESGALFTLAGIWDVWTDPAGGEVIKSFSVITTVANVLLAKVHNTRKRMPVILRKEDEPRWLDFSLGEKDVRAMLRSYDADEMTAHPVGKTINSLGLNTRDPSVLDEVDYPDLPEL